MLEASTQNPALSACRRPTSRKLAGLPPRMLSRSWAKTASGTRLQRTKAWAAPVVRSPCGQRTGQSSHGHRIFRNLPVPNRLGLSGLWPPFETEVASRGSMVDMARPAPFTMQATLPSLAGAWLGPLGVWIRSRLGTRRFLLRLTLTVPRGSSCNLDDS